MLEKLLNDYKNEILPKQYYLLLQQPTETGTEMDTLE
jgi:hypothetical protein